VTTGFQAYVFLMGRILEAAEEQLSGPELAALHDVLVELLARAIQARWLREEAA
jgi:hypothetical protein